MAVIRIIKKFKLILSAHQKKRIIQLAFLMIIGGILETCSVSLVLPFMNAVMNPEKIMNQLYIKWICNLLNLHSSRAFLVTMAVLLAILYLLKNVFLLFEINVQYHFVYGNMFEMQKRLLSNFIRRPYEYFVKVSSGEIIRIVNTDTQYTFQMLSTLLGLFTELTVSGMIILAVFLITPFVTIAVALALLAMLLCINFVIKPFMRRAGLEYQSSAAGMNKWLLQSIQGIKELKVMTREDFFQRHYDTYGRKYVGALRKNQILSVVPKFFIEATSMGLMFLVIAALIYKGTDLETVIPVLSAVALAAIRLLPSVNRISTAMASVSYNEPILDKLIENLKVISGVENVSLSMDLNYKDFYLEKEKKLQFTEKLEFSHISYHYPDSELNVLQDASVTISQGESVGIVGSSGAGKTTMVDIILGLLRPQDGVVAVDGVDIRQDMSSWLHQVGYIPQMIFMLDDTIRANVAFGVSEDKQSDEEVWRALREASLDDFVKGLPEGLDTQIGERGMRLSGGQRQRIGIARALYLNPSILIFDEATSALDNETESAIMESINNLHGHKTLIIIAHRLSTIKGCDHIYRVENGTINIER